MLNVSLFLIRFEMNDDNIFGLYAITDASLSSLSSQKQLKLQPGNKKAGLHHVAWCRQCKNVSVACHASSLDADKSQV